MRAQLSLCLCTLLLLPVSAHAKKDFLKILDLETGAKKSVPYRYDENCQERPVFCDEQARSFYMLRQEGKWFTLRRISYDGEVMEERRLLGFSCATYNGDVPAFTCAISPGGTSIVYYDYDVQGLSLYDIAAGTATCLIPGLTHTITGLLWAADTKVIALVSGFEGQSAPFSSAILLLDVPTAKVEVLYQDPSLARGGDVCALAPDHQHLAFFCKKSGEVKVLDLASREVLPVATREEDVVEKLCWSPDSAYLAYSLPTRGRIKVWSFKDQKEVVSKDWNELPGIVWGLFFLDATSLACACFTGELVTLNVQTGQVQGPLPQKVNGAPFPIDNGKKLVCIVNDAGGALSDVAEGVAETVGTLIAGGAYIAQRLMTGQGMPREGICIIDTETGHATLVQTPGLWSETLLATDDAKECFETLCATPDKVTLRTISYEGKVLQTRPMSGVKSPPEPYSAGYSLSPRKDAIAYYDMMAESLCLLDPASGQSVPLLANVDISVSRILWTAQSHVLLLVWSDSSDAGTFENAIVEVNPDEKTPHVLYKMREILPGAGRGALSPDRRSLLFTDDAPETPRSQSLQILDLETKQVRTIVPPQEDVFIDNACWSPDGTRIAYQRSVSKKLPEPTEADMKNIEKAVEQELQQSDFNQDRIQKLLDSVSGPRYAVAATLNIYSLAGGATTVVTKLSDADISVCGFLDKDRLIVRTGDPKAEAGMGLDSLHLLDVASGQMKKFAEGRFGVEFLPIAGGKKILSDMEEL